jgi:hypothetical protein
MTKDDCTIVVNDPGSIGRAMRTVRARPLNSGRIVGNSEVIVGRGSVAAKTVSKQGFTPGRACSAPMLPKQEPSLAHLGTVPMPYCVYM